MASEIPESGPVLTYRLVEIRRDGQTVISIAPNGGTVGAILNAFTQLTDAEKEDLAYSLLEQSGTVLPRNQNRHSNFRVKLDEDREMPLFTTVRSDPTGVSPLRDFPRVWRLFSFLLSKITKERIFEPAYQDLIASYAEARSPEFSTKWGRRWLTLCFTLRTAIMVCQCLSIAAKSGFAAVSLGLVPSAVRSWLASKWQGLYQ